MSTAAHDGEAPLPRLIPLRSMTKQEPNRIPPWALPPYYYGLRRISAWYIYKESPSP